MEAKQYKCPYCGAELKYSADKHKFSCEYCGGEFEEDDLKKQDSPEEAKAEKEFSDGTNLYVCPSCGAEIITDANKAADFCYYCHEPVILKGRLSGKYRPSYVLPFEFGKEKAVEIFNEFCHKKWFLPKAFRSSRQIEKLTGLYVPFWITDSYAHAHFEAIGEKVRTWSDGEYSYTKKDEYQVVRIANIKYDGLPADASKKIDDVLMQAIEPFNYTKLKPFQMAYLSGFYADKYDVDKHDVYPIIAARISDSSESILKSSTSYTNLKGEIFSSNIINIKWDYVLLPVWFMTFKYKGTILEYAINGQTGKISGQLPLSYPKMLIFTTALAAIIAIIVWIILYFMGE